MKIEELFNVSGKVAIVTGGSRGIGEMIAAGFLANGVKVYITARKETFVRKFIGFCPFSTFDIRIDTPMDDSIITETAPNISNLTNVELK